MTTKIQEAVDALTKADRKTEDAWNAWIAARAERDRLAGELERLEVRSVRYTLATVGEDTAVVAAVMRAMDRTLESGWKLATSKERSRPYILARRSAIIAMRLFGLPYETIGNALHLDHSTVIYHHKKAEPNEIAQGRVVARAAEQILSASSGSSPQ